MHAVVVKVTLNDVEAVLMALDEFVVDWVKSTATGYIVGYWTVEGNGGLAMIIFETKENAESAREQILQRTGSIPEMVIVEDVEVRKVVAHA